jgi:hypothetical protein
VIADNGLVCYTKLEYLGWSFDFTFDDSNCYRITFKRAGPGALLWKVGMYTYRALTNASYNGTIEASMYLHN